MIIAVRVRSSADGGAGAGAIQIDRQRAEHARGRLPVQPRAWLLTIAIAAG